MNKRDYESDAQTLRKAMKGAGTDERSIIKLVGNTTNADRQEIKKMYKSCFGKDLVEELDSELGGDLKDAVLGMFMTPVEYDAHCLYKAMKGMGTDEDALIEIIGSRSNDRLQQVKEFFKEKYKKDLEAEVKDETSGKFEKLLVALLQCNRDESTDVDWSKVQKDSKELYDAGEGKWGTDESVFIRIFSLRSVEHLRALKKAYEQQCGIPLEKSIDSEFSGDIKKLLLCILKSKLTPGDYFAERIYKACKGLGTNEKRLLRVLISRDEIDMEEIKTAYEKNYGKQLLSEIDDETGGDLKLLLLELAAH